MLDHFQSLRVAVVASSLRLAGAEKQTVYMTRALHRAGIETRFYHLGGDGHYEKDLRESGMPFQRIYTPRRPWAMLAGLSMALRDWRPDIVLVPQFGDLPFGTIAGRLCGALIVGGVRSDGFYELKERGRWSRGLIRLTDGLIANSQRARQNLVSQGIPAQKIAVLPNVIDLQEFDRRAATQCEVLIPPGRIVAAAVGSLHACKRFDRFLVALMLARSHEPALLGVIAGKDCGEQTRLHCQAHALGLTPDGVLFPGEVRNVPALLARSAFLALTSDYEGFPNVILEAMAARLPVLTVPAGDAELIVRNGQTGSVVDAEDIRNISRCMVEFAHSDATRREFGEAGRERVEQNYNHESLAKELTSIFHAFATQRQGRHWRDIRLRLQRVATASEIEEGLEFGRAASGLHKL